jgi:hypothetical protein
MGFKAGLERADKGNVWAYCDCLLILPLCACVGVNDWNRAEASSAGDVRGEKYDGLGSAEPMCPLGVVAGRECADVEDAPDAAIKGDVC